MPQGFHHVLGDVTSVSNLENGVELLAGTPRLRICAVTEGLFQVRFSQSGASFREQPFSYAVLPDFLSGEPEEVEVQTQEDHTRIRSGSYTAVVQHRPLRIHFEDAHGNVFAEDDFGITWKGDHVTARKRKTDGEHFYGLGERALGINRVGQRFTNWNTDYPAYQEWSDPLYTSFPFFIALRPCEDGLRRAYGIYLDNSYRSEFDFGGEMLDGFSFGAHGGEFVYYFIPGPEMTDVLRRYTAMTGRVPLPPRWALGYHQSRWSYFPDTEVTSIVRQFRERRIPLDAIYLDIHYMDAYRVFTWNPERFPDPRGLLNELRNQGVRAVVIINPGVKQDPGYFVHDEGLEKGMFVTYPDGSIYKGSVWPGACYFPDFTNPAVRQWFGDYYRLMQDAGVAGIWTDMNEPSNHRFRTISEIALHAFEGEGGTHAEAHNVYGLLMTRATYEGLLRHRPDERPFVLTRSGFSGSQRYAAVWTGDNVSNWEHLRLTLPMLLSLGLSGMPFCGSDVGGFFDSPTPELFARWIQIGAFSPFFRTHTIFESMRQEPWSFGPGVETISRKFIELRYRLMPVFYTLFEEHGRTGLPIIRPLVLHYPQDTQVHDLDDQFLLGEAILVAPILYEGAHSRKIHLPAGRWYDFWTGKAYVADGDTEYEPLLFSSLLEEMPVLVKGGTVIPLAPVLQHDGEREIVGLELRVFPGTGISNLYEDDGVSFAYQRGDFRRTTFSLLESDQGRYTLLREHTGSYTAHAKRYRMHIFGVEKPGEVSVDGRPLSIEAYHDETEPELEAHALYHARHHTLLFHAPADFSQIEFSAF